MCGNENDCNIVCLMLKSFTSYFPSIYITYTFFVLENNEIEKYSNECKTLYSSALSFYYLERTYFIFFSCVLAIIPVGAVLMVMKELWKGRSYKVD